MSSSTGIAEKKASKAANPSAEALIPTIGKLNFVGVIALALISLSIVLLFSGVLAFFIGVMDCLFFLVTMLYYL
jgi:hypothetical protein